MIDHVDRARPQTRLEVAADIRARVAKVAAAVDNLPGARWDEVLGEGAGAFFDTSFAEAILDGMIEGTITVGDPRLADGLQRLEHAMRSVPLADATQRYRHLIADDPEIEERVMALQRARLGIEGMTWQAVKAGLTTPGQDLSAGQGKGWAAHVS